MARRSNMTDRRPLIGEPIPDLPRSIVTPTQPEVLANLDAMSNSALIGIGLRNGIDPRELCGEETCEFHTTGAEAKLWKVLPANRIMHHGLQLGISVVWCRECFEWFRLS